jgi:formate dehydrogenase subunit beta
LEKTEQKLRAIARKFFESGRGKLFIGYRSRGTPARSGPAFIRNASDCEKLVYNEFCGQNLVALLPREIPSEGVIGIAVKGCDARAIVELVKQNQVRRESLYVVGLPCGGQIDIRKPGDRKREDRLLSKCYRCRHPRDFRYDAVVEVMAPQTFQAPEEVLSLETIEKMTPAERKRFWEAQFRQCLRCFACRSVCYGCYCRQCILLAKEPRWLRKTGDPEENRFFHMIRAMHMAGRCIECGECERVCPVEIPLGLLARKIQESVAEALKQEPPGIDEEEKPALLCFDPGDRDPSR